MAKIWTVLQISQTMLDDNSYFYVILTFQISIVFNGFAENVVLQICFLS